MRYTLEQLKAMSPEQRAQLYENARKLADKGGKEIIKLIEESGLPLRSGGMRLTDPVYLQMEEIAWMPAAKEAAIKATEAGLPALAGIEPKIVEKLGDQYQPHDLGTMSAGSIVGEVMRHLGYEMTAQDRCLQDRLQKPLHIGNRA